jgi:hypothetical protein
MGQSARRRLALERMRRAHNADASGAIFAVAVARSAPSVVPLINANDLPVVVPVILLWRCLWFFVSN